MASSVGRISARDIGRLLNVDTILEVRIQKAGDRRRVTAQLIDAGNGFHFCRERFARRITDDFAIQDEIMPKAKEAATKALALDHRLAEAYTTPHHPP